jgi:Protein of unknown function (DUF2630)
MDDEQIREQIERLVSEEHQLWGRESEGVATEDDRGRLDSLRGTLDQCWDLLRQRRALREAGLDEDAAHVRDTGVVEEYEQ